MLEAVKFVLRNGVRRTIMDAVMRQLELRRLERYESFEMFLCDEFGMYAVEGLVAKWQTQRVAELMKETK